MLLVQVRSLDLLTSSPAYYNCTTDAKRKGESMGEKEGNRVERKGEKGGGGGEVAISKEKE